MGDKEEKITVPKFNGKATDSFHLLKLRIETVLETKNCMSIVTGKEVRPGNDTENASEPQVIFDKRHTEHLLISTIHSKINMVFRSKSYTQTMEGNSRIRSSRPSVPSTESVCPNPKECEKRRMNSELIGIRRSLFLRIRELRGVCIALINIAFLFGILRIYLNKEDYWEMMVRE